MVSVVEAAVQTGGDRGGRGSQEHGRNTHCVLNWGRKRGEAAYAPVTHCLLCTVTNHLNLLPVCHPSCLLHVLLLTASLTDRP